jgi:hypothetical protein
LMRLRRRRKPMLQSARLRTRLRMTTVASSPWSEGGGGGSSSSSSSTARQGHQKR